MEAGTRLRKLFAILDLDCGLQDRAMYCGYLAWYQTAPRANQDRNAVDKDLSVTTVSNLKSGVFSVPFNS